MAPVVKFKKQSKKFYTDLVSFNYSFEYGYTTLHVTDSMEALVGSDSEEFVPASTAGKSDSVRIFQLRCCVWLQH
ncbi:uncharacterized protein RAG0_05954 [Rhynchosporium agropyri]|uniref:Uncharacterized protein n=3 Tax=Rhynchosporium TaxID=38037 RepID=A0A1E1MAH0_RHYSE|nr:uncharacterized protein RCO7_05008 [Rhynchosporium commune]CZS96757.1 uncharacterized protein RAG0_05954 [Rhynchosporium agropyri]CZT46074.1 uncharacterized protein RSE6_06453 [Rhynchosporium secalis]